MLKNQSEMNYISTFLAPTIKKLFKGYDNIEFMWSDTALAASKEEEYAAQTDDDTRSKGRIPDGVFTLKDYYMDFSLVEISGPPNTNNHQHHIGDRNKLAKTLNNS
ncbi:hypothetical protein BDB00DRAFT_550916 [Zychaea mexicana]|uniref:uncharacterized protein n=1 Tax=Zychaea mexicana TaxID=64656 RepID=UPI0022FEDD19|nr:uncharacterized protein BDB00DRAFT_550916 [Zychaea mexicana]KAI9490477.1 hypothetical protein BDB00DRAFT_550916 [Zychaea mexicana]